MSTDTTPAPPNLPAVVIGGTIAIDHVKTPEAEGANLLGGSAAYAALAASFFCKPVALIGIVGHDFPKEHLAMLESRGVTLDGVERSENESFTWSGEYHANMNERTTHKVGLNVLESWQVKVPTASAASKIVVLANMSPDNQMEMLEQCGLLDRGSKMVDRRGEDASEDATASSNPSSAIHNPPSCSRFVIADTMDLWIEIARPRLHEVLPQLDLFVLNEGEARELAGTSNLVKAGHLLLDKGPRHVVVKLGEFGAMLFSGNGNGGVEMFRASAWPLAAVADPTGAGDTFLGAMAGYLATQGQNPHGMTALRQAIVRGSMLASFTCEAFSTKRLEGLSAGELEERMKLFRGVTEW